MEEIEEITLNSLINDGATLVDSLYRLEQGNETARICLRDEDYSNGDEELMLCNAWIHKSCRYLYANYCGDIQINDFNLGKTKFDNEMSSVNLHNIVSILESIVTHPQKIEEKNAPANIGTQVNVTNSNSQNQSQSQQQSIEIFIEAIKDDLTGKQVRELKEIVAAEDNNLEKAKPKLIDKMMSFGEGVAASIVANILTNPSIWKGL